MKYYYIIYTNDSEYSSSPKYIAETFEEAEQVLLSGKYTDWYTSKGCGRIIQVNQDFKHYKTWNYWNGEKSEEPVNW